MFFQTYQLCFSLGDCYIWSNKLDRMPGYHSAQLYSYPARRWRKKRRQYLLNDHYGYEKSKQQISVDGEKISSSEQNSLSNSYQDGGGPPHSSSFNSMTNSITQNGIATSSSTSTNNIPNSSLLNDTFEDSKDSWMRDYDDGSDLPDAGELDDESDYDDDEEYTSSRRKANKRRKAQQQLSDPIREKRKRIEYTNAEKPFVCDICGIRYKTRPGLAYHYNHSHSRKNGGNGVSLPSLPANDREVFNNSNDNSVDDSHLPSPKNNSSSSREPHHHGGSGAKSNGSFPLPNNSGGSHHPQMAAAMNHHMGGGGVPGNGPSSGQSAPMMRMQHQQQNHSMNSHLPGSAMSAASRGFPPSPMLSHSRNHFISNHSSFKSTNNSFYGPNDDQSNNTPKKGNFPQK